MVILLEAHNMVPNIARYCYAVKERRLSGRRRFVSGETGERTPNGESRKPPAAGPAASAGIVMKDERGWTALAVLLTPTNDVAVGGGG
jgi:hypothetical protein